MKSGRPPKSINELDRDIIPIKLSFNQIKHILYEFRQHKPSSMEGQISIILTKCLRSWLEKKARQGKLPNDIAEMLMEDQNVSENPKTNTKDTNNE